MKGKIKENLDETEKMPVLFIGHGSPLNIMLRNDFTDSLVKLGKNLPKPEAIMVISAHWLTNGTWVSCIEKPGTIYDFYGFPDDLYAIEYPSPGSPYYARFVTESVQETQIKCNNDRGLDHASWAILKHMYPDADIPVRPPAPRRVGTRLPRGGGPRAPAGAGRRRWAEVPGAANCAPWPGNPALVGPGQLTAPGHP